jgi:hypothetical protein
MMNQTPLSFPQSLKQGDTVRIVCTARSVVLSEILKAAEWIENIGFKVEYGKTIGSVDHQFGGTDNERAEDLQNAINDPHVKAIWCARGGYGTARILDMIDFSALKKNPKWIIGFSDITALHAALYNEGLISMHAPMPINVNDTKENGASLKLMFGNYYRNRWHFEKIASGYSESHSLFIEQNGTKHIAGGWGNSLKYYRNNNDGWTDTLLESKQPIFNKLLAKDSLLYLLSNIRINDERTYLEIRKLAIENQVGIQEQPRLVDKTINIYPNPARETVNINFFSPEGQATIKIINLQGKQIYSTTVKNSNMGIFDFQWNRECTKGNVAPTGIYFVVIQTGEQVFAEKLVLF